MNSKTICTMTAMGFVLLACSQATSPKQDEGKLGNLEIRIDGLGKLSAASKPASAICEIYSQDMDTIRQSLIVSDSSISGIIAGIPSGNDRHILVKAYSTEGLLTFQGDTTSVIHPDSVVQINLVLLRKRGSITVNGTFDTTVDLSRGLVAFYPFSGSGNDYSGNSKHAIVHGASYSLDRFGRANSAMSFNGNSDYVKADLDTLPTVSVSLWMKAPNQALYYPHLLSYGQHFYVFIRGKHPDYLNGGLEGTLSIDQSVHMQERYDDSTWHHVVAIHDATRNVRELWVDGVLKASGTPENLAPENGELFLGKTFTDSPGNCAGCGYFEGGLDDVRVYSRALSKEEVVELAEER